MVGTTSPTTRPRAALAASRPTFLSHFSRITTNGRFVPEVDGLRFVAIAAVVVFHLAINLAARNPVAYPYPKGPLGALITSGELGVQIFFVISGLVLALPFARHHLVGAPRVRLRDYVLRRVTRLEPPYVLVMLGSFALLVVVHRRDPAVLTPHLLASLVYLHVPIYGHDSLINNVAWSLEVEIQFYVLVPCLTAVFAIRRTGLRRAVLVAAILVTSALGPPLAALTPHLTNTILRFAQYFLVGFLLADLMVCGHLVPAVRRWGWDLVALAAVPLVVMLHTETGPVVPLPGLLRQSVAELTFPWLVLAAYVGVFRGVALNALLTRPLLTTIGGMCYSIYLLHNVLGQNLTSLTSQIAPFGTYAADLAVQMAIVALATVATSAVFFVLVERPCMDKSWPRKLAARLRRGVPRRA